MTELKLGNKYECYNCGTKFYDMGRGEALCPKCEADQKEAEEENPLVSQSVKRQRKSELLPDDTAGDDFDLDDGEIEDGPLTLDDEDLAELEDDEEEEAEDEDED